MLPVPLIVLALASQVAPDVIVDTADGPRSPAPLLAMKDGFAVQIGGKKAATIPGDDLIALRRTNLPTSAEISGEIAPPFVQLVTGDRLPLAAPVTLALDDETLHTSLAAPIAGKFSISQSAVAYIALATTAPLPTKHTGDRVALKSGDRVQGRIVGIDARDVRFTVGDETTPIALDRIAQIDFDPEFQARPRIRGPFADVILVGGIRLSVAELTSAKPEGRLAAVTLFGNKISFAAADLVSLRMRNGRAVYLDERKPLNYEMKPFLDVTWPLGVGRSLLGGPLRIGNRTYPLGLATHAQSRVRFPVEPGDRGFEATVVIDPSAGPLGAARVSVELDGKEVGESRVVKAGDPPFVIKMDLAKAKTFTLVTDFGPRGDVQSHVLWLDARVLKASK